jgi:hypothetical protein
MCFRYDTPVFVRICCILTVFSKEWRGNRFHRTTLRELGMRFQLGHHAGETCLTPSRARGEFTVVHINGIHTVHIDFCGCSKHTESGKPVDKQIQLLEVEWWPSTSLEPQSAVSFDVLKQFQLLNLHGSLAGLEYYHTLEDLTNPDNLSKRAGEDRQGRQKPKKPKTGKLETPGGDDDVPPVGPAHPVLLSAGVWLTDTRTGYSSLWIVFERGGM